MKKTFKNLLCSAILLTLPMVSFAKNKAEKDSTYRPLYTAIELNIGSAAWIEKPLSYFTFDGPSVSLNLELMRAYKGNSKLVRQHQLRYMFSSGEMAISGNGNSKTQFGNYTFGLMTHNTVYPKLRLFYGLDANFLAGIVTNSHGGNNPLTFKSDISVGFTGMAVYDFNIGKYPITARYQMGLPIVSAFTQLDQGYLTESIKDGWRGGSWESRFNMRNRLLFDIHFTSWALRLGYNNDILTYYATPNHFQYVSHNLVIGFAGELMLWSKTNENKNKKHI